MPRTRDEWGLEDAGMMINEKTRSDFADAGKGMLMVKLIFSTRSREENDSFSKTGKSRYFYQPKSAEAREFL